MAEYHCSVKTIGRSSGRSATAAAAYRAGRLIVDERTGEVHDYRRKKGVVSSEIILPPDAPEWAADSAQLWNRVEQAEKRVNATVAREFEIALPDELSPSQREKLARDFASELVEKFRFAAEVSIHEPSKGGDDRNHHAHILVSTRSLGPEGFTEKTRDWDDRFYKGPQLTEQWRERFATLQNQALEAAGSTARVDHRSHARRGIKEAPSAHLGPTATAIERRTGEHSRIRIEAAERAEMLALHYRELDALRVQQTEIDEAMRSISAELDEARRIRGLSVEALTAEILRIQATDLDVLVAMDKAVLEASRSLETLRDDAVRIRARIDDWVEAHPHRTRWGVGVGPLRALDTQLEDVKQTITDTSNELKAAQEAATARLTPVYLKGLTTADEMKDLKKEKVKEGRVQGAQKMSNDAAPKKPKPNGYNM